MSDDEIEGEALMKKLAKFTRKELEAGASPRTIVKALLAVGGNVGMAHLGVMGTTRLFRNLAGVLEARAKKSAH